MKKLDKIFTGDIKEIVDFKFDEKVANVFEDMLRRSIPGYSTIIAVTGMFAEKFAQPETNIYDLGCSLGASALSMQQKIKQPGCKIIAVDNSPQMLQRAKDFVDNSKFQIPIELVEQDVTKVNITNASVVVLNLTLQFVSPEKRLNQLEKIYRGLTSKGILILTEKVKYSDESLNERQSESYYDFKEFMGYSRLEISRKRDALENVMILDSLEYHLERLKKLGFSRVDVWFQIFNFVSIIAVK